MIPPTRNQGKGVYGCRFLCLKSKEKESDSRSKTGKKMNLTKDQKKQKSQDLASEITTAGTLFFTAYQGLKFVDMAALRAELVPTGAKFRVERNAIVEHAIRQANIEGADSKLFQGPTAIAVGGDIAAVAKALVDFQKKFAALKLRALISESTGNFHKFAVFTDDVACGIIIKYNTALQEQA